jgi:hypothetical protein
MASHHIFNFVKINHATPVLLMALSSVFILAIQIVFKSFLQRWGFTMSSKDIMVDEDLPNFFKSVKLQ